MSNYNVKFPGHCIWNYIKVILLNELQKSAKQDTQWAAIL